MRDRTGEAKLVEFIKNKELLMEEKLQVKRRRQRKQEYVHRLGWGDVSEAFGCGRREPLE